MAGPMLCKHPKKYDALRLASNGHVHRGEWCPDCRRFVPDAVGRYWHPQQPGDKDVLPLMTRADAGHPKQGELFNG